MNSGAGSHAAIEWQTQATDERIDQLVHELYGLTEGEVRSVEEGKK